MSELSGAIVAPPTGLCPGARYRSAANNRRPFRIVDVREITRVSPISKFVISIGLYTCEYGLSFVPHSATVHHTVVTQRLHFDRKPAANFDHRHAHGHLMDYQFTSISKPTHLHAIGSGQHSAENVQRFLADTHRLVVAENHDAVLLEIRFEGPSLDFGTIYSIIVQNRHDASLVKRIAYVDTNAQHISERAEFAELAANKLGLNARAFRSVAEAERWLAQ
jgi:hypothetical protein